MNPKDIKPGRVYSATIHAQTGTTRREVITLRWIEELPTLGMVLVEDVRSSDRFVVHWLKLEKRGS